jgi:transcriptional regulator GlxA family with amidase domain
VAHSEWQTPKAEVGLLLYPKCHVAMIHGMTDLLQVASGFSVARGGPPLRITHWSMDGTGAITRCHDTHPGIDHRPDVLIVPAVAPAIGSGRLAGPILSGPLEGEEAAPFAAWLAERHAKGATLASIFRAALRPLIGLSQTGFGQAFLT